MFRTQWSMFSVVFCVYLELSMIIYDFPFIGAFLNMSGVAIFLHTCLHFPVFLCVSLQLPMYLFICIYLYSSMFICIYL